MTPRELRTIARLCADVTPERWLAPLTHSENSSLQQLFSKGYAERRERTGGGWTFEYRALMQPITEARKLGIIPEDP